MTRILLGAAVLALVAGTAHAEQKYDRTLEQAAVDIVAAKMGDLRGGFAYDEAPRLVRFRSDGALVAQTLQPAPRAPNSASSSIVAPVQTASSF